MRVAVSEAKALLTDLVRRVEAGEEVVLTRHGRDVARIEQMLPVKSAAERARAIREIIAEGRRVRDDASLSAARVEDFLYDDKGMP